jgi:hypothetical protein
MKPAANMSPGPSTWLAALWREIPRCSALGRAGNRPREPFNRTSISLHFFRCRFNPDFQIVSIG